LDWRPAFSGDVAIVVLRVLGVVLLIVGPGDIVLVLLVLLVLLVVFRLLLVVVGFLVLVLAWLFILVLGELLHVIIVIGVVLVFVGVFILVFVPVCPLLLALVRLVLVVRVVLVVEILRIEFVLLFLAVVLIVVPVVRCGSPGRRRRGSPVGRGIRRTSAPGLPGGLAAAAAALGLPWGGAVVVIEGFKCDLGRPAGCGVATIALLFCVTHRESSWLQ
jgi:hypothetical protein